MTKAKDETASVKTTVVDSEISNDCQLQSTSHRDLILATETENENETALLNQVSEPECNHETKNTNSDSEGANDSNSDSDDEESDLESVEDIPVLGRFDPSTTTTIPTYTSTSSNTTPQVTNEESVRRAVLIAVTHCGLPRAMYSALPEDHPAHFSTDMFLVYLKKLGVVSAPLDDSSSVLPLVFSMLVYLQKAVDCGSSNKDLDKKVMDQQTNEQPLDNSNDNDDPLLLSLLLGILHNDEDKDVASFDNMQVFMEGYDKDSVVSKIKVLDR